MTVVWWRCIHIIITYKLVVLCTALGSGEMGKLVLKKEVGGGVPRLESSFALSSSCPFGFITLSPPQISHLLVVIIHNVTRAPLNW
jgi:hypothetical protein